MDNIDWGNVFSVFTVFFLTILTGWLKYINEKVTGFVDKKEIYNIISNWFNAHDKDIITKEILSDRLNSLEMKIIYLIEKSDSTCDRYMKDLKTELLSEIKQIHLILKNRTLLAKSRGANLNVLIKDIIGFLQKDYGFIPSKYPMQGIDETLTNMDDDTITGNGGDSRFF